ncbi:MAG: nucleotidyltransferase domain-containing protein [Cyanobacteria bacterium J06621_8]
MKQSKPALAIEIPEELIKDFCQRWRIKEFYLFGSVLRDDFGDRSDIDVMVQSFPNPGWGWKIVTMNEELEQIFGRKVDLVFKDGIERSENWLRREDILRTARLIYEQE